MEKSFLIPVYNRTDVKFISGKGAYLVSDKKEKYLDFAAGIAVNSLGHNHKKLNNALIKQAKKLWHISNLYQIEGLEELAKKYCDNSFADAIFFCNSGTEAVETGIKIIRKYFDSKGQFNKNRIITFTGAFHGRSIATISATDNVKYKDGFAPLLSGFDLAEFNNINSVIRKISQDTAAILIEPIQGESGIKVADTEFLVNLRKICNENNIFLFFDEVQCGMGRTGKLFYHQFLDIEPDILASAKGIGGGFPMAACFATKEIISGMTKSSHGGTYGGNPLASAVGNFVIDEITKPSFLDNVIKMGDILKSSLLDLQKKYPDFILDVRGTGLMLGLKVKIDNLEFTSKLRQNKLLVVPAGENVIRIIPPLIITEKEIKYAIAIIDKTIKEAVI